LRSALVIGGGISGMNCALSLANQGIKVHLVEKSECPLGEWRKGFTIRWKEDVQHYLKRLIEGSIIICSFRSIWDTEIRDFSGYVGNFQTTLETGGKSLTVELTMA
jgi:heterodisulfide reductase subunit A